MQVQFFEGSRHIDTLKKQVAIPRTNENVIFDGAEYFVERVVWDYDIDIIYIYLDLAEDQ